MYYLRYFSPANIYCFFYFLFILFTVNNTLSKNEEIKTGSVTEPEILKENINIPVIPIPFENKYMERFLSLKSFSLDEDKINSLDNVFIIENTPLGNVIMKYDSYKESFVYYSDYNIPYRYLETCSRKYVLTYNCKSLYVDMKEEIQNEVKKLFDSLSKPDLPVIETEIVNTEPKVKNGPFYKVKNTSFKEKIPTVKTDNSLVPKNEPKIYKNKIRGILKRNANRYTYCGKIANFNFLKKETANIVQKLSYSSFKNRNKI